MQVLVVGAGVVGLAIARAAALKGHEVDLDALADMIATLVEGGLILGRALNDITILPRQVLLYRDFVRSVFAPAG